MKFTESNIVKLRPPARKADHWQPDEALPGFGVRFRNGGVGVYGVRYSIAGRDRRLSYHPVAKVTLADARAWAKHQFALVAGSWSLDLETSSITCSGGFVFNFSGGIPSVLFVESALCQISIIPSFRISPPMWFPRFRFYFGFMFV